MSERPTVQPQDEHNRRLREHCHPPDWHNPKPADHYNLVVIGAGTGGLVTAVGAAGVGAKVALVERHLTGGDCLNVGCVPSKCMIRSGRAAAEAMRAKRYGVPLDANAVQPDFGAVMERMRRIRAEISEHDSVQRLTEEGVDVFLGQAQFVEPGLVRVDDGSELHYSRAVIATGARAWHPPVDGLEEAGFLTNENVFELTERPPRLGVLGAGPIGCELSQVFQRLGSQVTVFEQKGRILSKEDVDASRALLHRFRSDGVEVKLKSTVCSVEVTDEGKEVCYEQEGRQYRLPVDQILVGAGRAPNVQGLGLENAGVGYDEHHGIEVDDRLRTTNKDVYAVGDCCMKHKFTHMADAAARLVISNALFFGRGKLSDIVVPWCTYTDPEVAHTGLYGHQAEARGIKVRTFKVDFEEVDRALADGATDGFVKVHVTAGTDEILGATIVAPHAGEMISELTLAIQAGVGLKQIAQVVHPYPTQAEAIRHIADQYNKTRLTPLVEGLLKRILSWRR